MKTTFSLLFALLTSQVVCAQFDGTEKQFIVNATGFTKTFLSFNDVEAPSSRIEFGYKTYQDNKAWRFYGGIGGSYTDNDEFFNVDKVIRFSTGLSAGREFRIPLGKRFRFMYGIDLLVDYDVLTTIQENDFGFATEKVKTKTHFIGGGFAPVAGIQFNLSDRVALMTETSFALECSYSETKNIIDSDIDSQDRTDLTDHNFTVGLMSKLPTSLFLVVSF